LNKKPNAPTAFQGKAVGAFVYKNHCVLRGRTKFAPTDLMVVLKFVCRGGYYPPEVYKNHFFAEIKIFLKILRFFKNFFKKIKKILFLPRICNTFVTPRVI
jgi:hypothetical protein